MNPLKWCSWIAYLYCRVIICNIETNFKNIIIFTKYLDIGLNKGIKKIKSHMENVHKINLKLFRVNISSITYIKLMTVSRIYINYFKLLVICGNWIVITWIKFSRVYIYIFFYKNFATWRRNDVKITYNCISVVETIK